MNSPDILFIQLALRPMTLVTLHSTEYTIKELTDFSEFFEAVRRIQLAESLRVIVNRGPGSYSGIRTGIAYTFGLLHTGRVPRTQIHSITSFDLIRAATGHVGPVYLKAWPRIPSGRLEDSKGYFEDSDHAVKYATYEEVIPTTGTLFVGEEAIITSHQYRQLADLLRDPICYRQAAQQSLSTDLTPLYINPVHIT